MIKFVAELVHAFALQFLHNGARLVGGKVSGTTVADLVVIATAFSVAIVVMIYRIGPISGSRVNPAVTLGAFVIGRIRALAQGAHARRLAARLAARFTPLKAAAFAAAGAVFTFFGLIHAEALGIGRTPSMVISYLGIAAILLACSRYAGLAPLPGEASRMHGHGDPAAKPAE